MDDFTPDSAQVDFFSSDVATDKESPSGLFLGEPDEKKEEPKVEEPAVDEDEAEEVAPGGEEDEEEEVVEAAPGGDGRKKPITIKTARKEFRFPAASKVVVFANGKREEVPFDDVLKSYSSEKGIQKKLGEAEAKERSATQKETQISERLSNFVKNCETPENLMPALGELLDESGIDPLPAIRALRDSVAAAVLDMVGVDEATVKKIKNEIKYYDTVEEAAFYRQKITKSKEREKSLAGNQKLGQEVERVMAEAGIADLPSFQKSFEDLRRLKGSGKLKLEDITPDDVGTFHRVGRVVDEHFPQLRDDSEGLARLFRVAREFAPNDADLLKVARNYFGSDKSPSPTDKGTPSEKPKLSSKPKTAKQSGTKQSTKLSDLFL